MTSIWGAGSTTTFTRFSASLLGLGLATIVLLGAFASAAAAKEPIFDFGSSGSQGGQFSAARGIAVNEDGNGGVPAGTVYVAENGNRRIQSVSADGNFIRAWGWDVVTGGGEGFEVCEVAAECQAGDAGSGAGQFTFNSATGDIAVDQATGNVTIVDRTNNRVQQFDAVGNFIRTWGKDVVTGGGEGFEICEVAAECKAGVAGSGAGMFGGSVAIVGIGTDATGNLYVADPANRRVQKFDPEGNFLAMGGWNVDSVNASIEYEVCTVAANCQAGASGTGTGQFGTSNLPSFLATSPAGDVYAVSRSDGTIYQLDSALAFIAEFPATAGSNNNRNAVAVNNGDGHLFFTERTSTNIFELDPGTASVVATHPAEGNEWVGLAVNSNSGRLYAARTTSASSIRVLSDPLPEPVAVVDPIAVKDDTTATFTGTVDPQGGPITCAFQYATSEAGPWTDLVDPECASLAPSGGAQAVEEDVTGLIPNTEYFVRIEVSRGPTHSNVETFTTDPVPPVVSNVGATEVRDTSVRFVGTIDPRHSPTGYVFEYGTTPALGSTTSPVDIGGGSTPVIVSSVVTGLSPDTTYYFRLSATSLIGTTTSGATTLKTRSVPSPTAPKRKYEQATPVALNNVDAGILEQAMMTVARDGQTIGVCNFYPPEGEGIGFCGSIYNSRRTATGWQARSFLPPTCRVDPATGKLGGGILGGSQLFSENLDLAIFERPEWSACPYPPATLHPDAQTDFTNLYRGDLVAGSYDLLAPNPGDSSPGEKQTTSSGSNFGASDDFGVLFYQSNRQQTQDAPTDENISKLFEWDHGELRLASVRPNGEPFAVDVELAHASTGGVSADGGRAFFHSPPSKLASPQLYMREGGAATYDLGQTECTAACGSLGLFKRFAGASEDGSMAFFETPQKLSDEDNNNNENNDVEAADRDLYLYRQSADPGSERNLWVLTRDLEPADGTAAGFRGVIGKSEDGETVFFAAAKQIVAGAPTAAGFKVYRWRWNGGAPQVDFLANLDGTVAGNASCNDNYKQKTDTLWTDEHNWNCAPRFSEATTQLEWVRRVRADGGQLTIDTIKPLVPIADTDTTRDVYTWEEAHGWRCVSCQQPDVGSAGAAQSIGPLGVNGLNYPTQNDLAVAVMSADGRIFFTARDELVPSDTNGSVRDVYEWNDGAVSLISSGTGTEDNLLVGTSDSGDDVFFVTSERLVGWDTDHARDIYDARVGGGFPEPLPEGAPCEGEGCRGAGTSAPAGTGAGTGVFQGPGNPPRPTTKRCAKGNHEAKRLAKRARALRRAARKASSPRRAGAMRKRARRLAKAAKRKSRAARRCRRARTSNDRRASR